MRRYLVLLLLLAAVALAATPLGKEFEEALRPTQNADQAMEVITAYRDRLTDLEDLRQLQNYWMQIDPDGCRGARTATSEAHAIPITSSSNLRAIPQRHSSIGAARLRHIISGDDENITRLSLPPIDKSGECHAAS